MLISLKNIARSLRSHCPIWRDWFYFSLTYKDVCGFSRYAWKRFFPFFSHNLYVPHDKKSTVIGNILVGKNSRITQRGGCYVQGIGKIFIGDYVDIAQNCVIVSAIHELLNQDIYKKKETIIGDYCWIASNVCINAGVVLGPRTIVGAGSVVTRSFPEGFCLIAGNPAKLIRELPKENFVPRKYPIEHYGFIRADKFPAYKMKHLQHLRFHYDLSKVTSNVDLIKDSVIKD